MSKLYEYPCDDNTTCHPITVELLPGRYLIECYGAQGGTGYANGVLSQYPGGKGAYASGILNLKKTTTFYLYIGGKGQNGINAINQQSKGGWNGGGNSGRDIGSSSDAPDTSGAGGGCTDIRLVKAKSTTENTANDEESDEATNLESLNSRIIVAAGGSGSAGYAYGAPGGDLTGYIVNENGEESYDNSDTTQTNGYKKGRGENGEDYTLVPSSGAGAGYYGGKKGTGSDWLPSSVSSSGSSYVAGFEGCPPLSNEVECSSFGCRFLKPLLVNGFSKFPSFDSYEEETGHSGNGAIKITQLETCTKCSQRRSEIILFCFVIVLTNNRNGKINKIND